MPEDAKVFSLKYAGARFFGARLPLDVLSDLPAFRDLLVSYAKDHWREQHAARQRLPKGFDQSITFDLVGVAQGSAVAQLAWSRQIAQTTLPGFSDELESIVEQSYNDVVNLIDEAGQQRYPSALSPEQVRALNKLGAGLREGEKIEFPRPSDRDGHVVFLDAFRRRDLITHVRETYQVRYEGIGVLNGLHVDDGWISVSTDDRGEVRVSLDRNRVSDEFDGNTGGSVQFALQIELDRGDKLRSVIDVFDVDLIDPQIVEQLEKCKARLGEFESLGEGWLDGAGESIATEAIRAADAFLTKRPAFAEIYGIFPTSDGGILIEFQNGTWDISVEFTKAGGIEMSGVEINGPNDLPSRAFEAVNERFLAEFDSYARASTRK
jgi:hypothetical protein